MAAILPMQMSPNEGTIAKHRAIDYADDGHQNHQICK